MATDNVAPPEVMLIFVIIFVITYWLIIDHRVNKHFAAFLGGTLVLLAAWATRFITNDFQPLISEDALIEHMGADIVILVIIVGNLIVVDVGLKSGLFHFISIKILKLTHGDPKRLLLYMGLLSVALSVVVNNISAILISASLTILACERLDYDPHPYIISQMVLVNVGGLYTLVSSVPNIIIGTELGISYFEFLQVGVVIASYLVIISLVAFLILLKLPKPTLSPEDREKIVKEFDEWAAVTNRRFFNATALILTVMVILFLFSSWIGLSIMTISLAGAVAMLIVSGVDFDEALKALDWPLLAFFTGLFVVIAALDLVGVITTLATGIKFLMGDNIFVAALVILILSSILSGIVDNIVIAAALAPIVSEVSTSPDQAFILGWALVIGANLGGGFTPIGAPSNVIGIGILSKRTGKKIGWSGWKIPALMTVLMLLSSALFIVLLTFVIYVP